MIILDTYLFNVKLKFVSVAVLCIISFVCFSGVIRHDVSEKKYIELANQKQFECIGQCFINEKFHCSFILIDHRYVLSAAHCFVKRNEHTLLYETDDPCKYTFRCKGQEIHAKRILIYPKYLDASTNGSCDIALVELEEPFNKVEVAKVNTEFDELNSEVVGVGFGAFGIANKPETVQAIPDKKIAGENRIDSIGGYKLSDKSSILFADFDCSDNESCNQLGTPEPMPLEYIGAGGDSGGGLFSKKDEEWKLIGVFSSTMYDINRMAKTDYYGQIMGWTRVSLFADWLKNEINK